MYSELSFLLSVENGCGVHSASYLIGIGGSFPLGVKRTGCEVDHWPESSAEIKKMCIYISSLPFVFME
jgi:hypothetical protein